VTVEVADMPRRTATMSLEDVRALPRPTKKPKKTTTDAPTKAPTKKPKMTTTKKSKVTKTSAPTGAPTGMPADEPAEEPTEEITKLPSQEPTYEPSEAPTETPTDEPTEGFSESSSEEPTEDPAQNLTEEAVVVQIQRMGFNDATPDSSGVNDVLTVNPQAWEAKVQKAIEAGSNRIFCVFDFDRTMTKCFLEDGSASLCSHDILGSIPKITTACKNAMDEASDFYYPIETDVHMSRAEKIPHMEKWYAHTNDCLASQNITRADMINAVAGCENFCVRKGVEEAFQILHDKGIPVIIISAGVGNVIEEVVRQCIAKTNGPLSETWPNVRVLSNNMLWDNDGQFVDFSDPLIHMFNKSLQDAPVDVRQMLDGRDIGILCGDGLGDLTMAHGVESTDILKFGFLNEKVQDRLPKYTGPDGFDRVILNDGGWGAILDDVLRKI